MTLPVLLERLVFYTGLSGLPGDARQWLTWASDLLGPPALAMVLFGFAVAVSVWPDLPARLVGRNPWRRVPLAEACRVAYEKTRAADRFGHDPTQIERSKLRLHAFSLLVEAERGELDVWGQSTPSTKWERVPKERLSSPSALSDDLSRLPARGVTPSIEWRNLSVTRGDLREHIKRNREPSRGR